VPHPKQHSVPSGKTFRRNSLRLEARFDGLIITIPLLFKAIHGSERRPSKVFKQSETTLLLADLGFSPIYYSITNSTAIIQSQFEENRLLPPCGHGVDKIVKNGSV
jgi:hypothetical protein